MTTSEIIFGLAVFLIAGTVKGLVGLGLPTITIALTSLVLPLPEAIAREKQLKNWRREKKPILINRSNPEWRDLSGEID